MPSSVAASPSKAPRTMTRAGGGDFGSVVATTSTIAMPQATPAAMVDTSRYGNAITIASANVPPARASNGSADNSVAGGGGGVGAPTPSAAQPPSTPAASAATVQPSVVVPASTATASTPSTGIRPMALVANQQTSKSQASSASAPQTIQSASNSTPTSTTTPPTLFISGGYGKRATDAATVPIPSVMQGSQWSGQPILQGNNASQYNIVSYTWTFPTGALKGYGAFVTKTYSGVSGTYFAGDPTDAANTKVESQGFTADDLNTGTNDPFSVNSLYFGPESTGNLVISVSANVQNTTTLATMTLGDSVTVNVVKPTGSIDLNQGSATNPTGSNPIPGSSPPQYYPAFGTAGVSTYTPPTPQRLQFDANSVAGGPHGIDWVANVNPTATGIATVSGQFSINQTMTYQHTRVYSGVGGGTQSDGLLNGGASPGVILDLAYYAGTTTVGGTAASPTTQASNDSPSSGLDPAAGNFSTPVSNSRSDNFTMTLMFQPSGGIWVPVGTYQWSWSGGANWVPATANWKFAGGSQSPGSYSPSTTFPTWSHTFTELANNWQ